MISFIKKHLILIILISIALSIISTSVGLYQVHIENYKIIETFIKIELGLIFLLNSISFIYIFKIYLKIKNINVYNIEFFKILLDHLPMPIFFKNLEGIYLYVNKSFLDNGIMKESDIKKIIGKHTSEIYGNYVNPEMLNSYLASDLKIFRTLKPDYYITVLPIDGETKKFLTFKFPYFSLYGNVIGIVGFAVNLGDFKKFCGDFNESNV